MERNRRIVSYIREQTKVEDILIAIDRKRSCDEQITDELLEKQNNNPEMVKEGRAEQRTSLRDELGSFARVTWNRQAADRN